MSEKKLDTNVVTPEAVACFVKLLAPEENLNGVLKYSVCLAFPDSEDLSKIKTAIYNAVVNRWGEDKTKWPKNLKFPLRSGSEKEKDLDFWVSKMFINANSDRKPGLVDAALNPILNSDEIYSGMIIRAAVNFYAFEKAGNRGIACGLNHVMKVKDGDRLGGGPSIEEAFSDFATVATATDGDLDFLS